MESGTKRLPQLDGLRIIAIIMIALGHMQFLCMGPVSYPYSNFFRLHLHNPDLGVDYFFMLSGFGMLMASMKNDSAEITLKGGLRYAWLRIRKIYPFYLFSMALMVPSYLGIIQTGQTNTGLLKSLLTKLPFVVTLTQSMTGIRSFSRALNPVCWFLSSLSIIYVVSPLLISCLKKRAGTPKKTILIMLLTFFGLLFFTWVLLLLDRNEIFGRRIFNDLFYSSPYIRVFYVAIGMEIGLLFCQLSARCRVSFRGELCAAAIGLLYYWCKRLLPENSVSEIVWVRAIDVSVCAIVLGVFAFGSSRLSASLGKIGKMSGYVIFFYLFHAPILYYINQLFISRNIYFGPLTGIVETLLIFGLSIAAAVICRKVQDRIFR